MHVCILGDPHTGVAAKSATAANACAPVCDNDVGGNSGTHIGLRTVAPNIRHARSCFQELGHRNRGVTRRNCQGFDAEFACAGMLFGIWKTGAKCPSASWYCPDNLLMCDVGDSIVVRRRCRTVSEYGLLGNMVFMKAD